MTMIRGLAEIVLSVHDLDASLRFYRDTLGLTLVSEPDFRPVFLRAGDPAVTVPQLVVLVPLPAGTPPFPAAKPGRTLHHLAFELAPADFDAMHDHLAAQGFADPHRPAPRHPLPHHVRGRPGRQRSRIHRWNVNMQQVTTVSTNDRRAACQLAK